MRFFFFSSRRRHTRCSRDWSSDVCSSDLLEGTELAQLFRRGYRAELARNVTGGGLGLYFSNGIVAAHGGRMWAESPGHGQGSTFCFTLPLREERSAYRPAVEHA